MGERRDIQSLANREPKPFEMAGSSSKPRPYLESISRLAGKVIEGSLAIGAVLVVVRILQHNPQSFVWPFLR